MKAFEDYEEIGITLPNLYKCSNCSRTIFCLYPPEDGLCAECSGVDRPFEKVAHDISLANEHETHYLANVCTNNTK